MTRKLSKRERTIANLSRELEQDEHARTPFLPTWARSLSNAEKAFVRRAIERNVGTVHRAHWPTFLVEEPGGIYAVEVKQRGEVIREEQRATFSSLDRNGVRVYVWQPSTPHKLIPWEAYGAISQHEGNSAERELTGSST